MAGLMDTLKKLQTIDSGLFRLKREKQEKPRELEAAEQVLKGEEGKLKVLEDRLKTLQLEQKQKENDLQAREDQIKKLKGQLMQLKTNREYTAMQHEIDSLAADQSLLEETIIRVLDGIDAAAKEKKGQEARVKERQQILARERARIEQEQAKIDEDIGRLERDRKTILPDVDSEALNTYERVLGLREGLALVAVSDESCGGCDRRLPPQVINQVHLAASLVTCESCNRILYKADA